MVSIAFPYIVITAAIGIVIVLLRLAGYRFRTGMALRYLWFYKLTPNGRYLVYIGCIALTFGGASIAVPVYILLSMFLLLGMCAVVVNWLQSPKLEIEGAPPGSGIAGQPLTVEVRVRNLGRRPALDVDVAYAVLPNPLFDGGGSAACPLLAPGHAYRAQRQVVAMARGIYRLPRLSAFSTFPFGIARSPSRAAVPPKSLVVVPDYHPIEAIELPVGRRYQPGGVSMSSEVGESPEYLGNREFRPGDRVKHLDHRAWARTGSPAVREYREEFYCRVALILDTQVPRRIIGRRRAGRRFEAAVSLAAAVSEALARGEYLVDLFAAGPNLHVFRAGRHTAHFENILEILAGLGPTRREPFREITSELADEIARTSSVVCIFLKWDEARRKLVELAVDSGCAVKVLLVGNHDGASIPEEFNPRVCPVADIEAGRLVRL